MADSTDARDIFYRQDLYPDAADLMSWAPATLQEVKDVAIVVVDTNALLVPYGTGKASLEEIGKRYRTLVDQQRLVVPGQVVREFASNRALKLQELHSQLTRKRQITVSRVAYPLLEGLPAYAEMVSLEEQLDNSMKAYRTAVDSVLTEVKLWHWNDPVSRLYKELFGGNVVLDPTLDREEAKQDLDRRIAGAIPPGYKDARKDDGGIGDLLIWRTILEIGKSRKCHTVFVSGDQKTDWWHQSEGSPLYPRFELVDEYRRNSDGHTLHLATFSAFLELTGASKAIVEEVRKEEQESQRPSPLMPGARTTSGAQAIAAALRWIQSNFEDVASAQLQYFDVEIPVEAGKKVAVKIKFLSTIPPTSHLQRMVEKMATMITAAEPSLNISRGILLLVAHSRPSAKIVAARARSVAQQGSVAIVVSYVDAAGELHLAD